MRKLNLLWLVGLCSCSMLEPYSIKNEFNKVFKEVINDYISDYRLPLSDFKIELSYCEVEEVLDYKIHNEDISFRTDKGNIVIKLDKLEYTIALQNTYSDGKITNIEFYTNHRSFIINNSYDKNYIFTNMSFDCSWNNNFKTIDVENDSFFMFTTIATYSKIEAKKILNKTLDL